MKKLRLNVFRLLFIAYSILIIVSCNEKKQFDGFLYPIRENGLYGYIDSVGNRIIEPEFLWVSTFHNGLAMAVVDTIYRVVPDSMAYEVGERDTILNVYRMYAKYGYIDKSGNFVIEPKFVSYVNMNEIGDVTNDMDDCSNALYRNSFRNKRAMFSDTLTWKNGYIDTKGNIVIEPIYFYSKPFSHGRAVIKELIAEPVIYDDLCLNPSKLRCSYIDTLGNPTTQNKYESLTNFNGRRGIGSFTEIIKDSAGNKQGYTIHNDIIDGDGNLIKDLGIWNSFYDYSRDGISVARQVMHFQVYDGMFDSYSFVDEEGNYLQPLKGLTENQIDSLNKCDDILEVLSEDAPIADATYFNDGFAGITPDCKRWFVIDKYLIIHGYGRESIFDGFQAFNNGLAAVKKNGKWGFINRKIKEQIPCKYDSCGIVYPYLEEVFEYDIQGEVKKRAYINRKDSLVWESPIYKSEKIENRYSIKDNKDWGQWIYKYNPIKEYLPFLIIGAIVVLCILFVVVWKTTSNRHPKVVANKELVTRIEPELEVVSDASPTITTEVDPDEILSYPTVGQYTEAIMLAAKSPDDYFDKLKHLCPVLDSNGEPIMSSANFAVVFKMRDEYGKQYAVRCFHRAQHGREKNYKLICDELAKVSSPYLSPIKYYEKELFIDTDEYPVLLMDWVDGTTLDKYIRKVLDDKKALRQLTDNFRKLSIWLLSQPFAHGDLKPDNILVKKDGSLVLVDYDGMYVPAMQGQWAREIGSPDFRSPLRTEMDFDKNIDNFPIVSILLSLELQLESKDYLSDYGAEDRLLFSKADYDCLENSEMYKIAYSSYNDDISELALELKSIINNNEEAARLITLLKRKETRKIEKSGNEKIEKIIEIIILLYNLAIPIIAYICSRVIRPRELDELGVSIGILGSSIILYVMINILDAFRPYKGSHLYIDDDVTSFGCVLGMFDIFIAIGCMLSSVVHREWYITTLIIGIWIFFFYINACLCSGSISITYFSEFFKSKKRRREEIIENEKEKIRSEIRIKQEQRKKVEAQKVKQSELLHEDLPF